MSKKILLIAILEMIIMGCLARTELNPQNNPAHVKPAAPHAVSKEKCEEGGGEWGTFGLMIVEECNFPTTDAGQPCKDHSECQSSCITDDDIPEGQEVIGRCFEWTIPRGTCQNIVTKGIARGVLCVD